MIDPESYKKHGPAQVLGVYYREEKHKKIPEDDGETDDENQEWEPAEEPEAFGGGPLWEAYKDIQPGEGKDLLKHQLMLLPADIRGFALKTKQWSEINTLFRSITMANFSQWHLTQNSSNP